MPFCHCSMEYCASFFSLNSIWQGISCSEAWQVWWEQAAPKKLRNLPPIIRWGLWIAINVNDIFQAKATTPKRAAAQVLATYDLIADVISVHRPRNISPEVVDCSHPWAYFDGTSIAGGECGGESSSFSKWKPFPQSPKWAGPGHQYKRCIKNYTV